MRIVEPEVQVTFHMPEGYSSIEQFIEACGRTCYKSEERISDGSADAFVRMIQGRGHHSVLEHASATVRFVCDRGTTHELVRHRIAAFSQESTRYCNYSKDRFEGRIAVIQPPFVSTVPSLAEDIWREAMEQAESAYFRLLGAGEPPEIARAVLPIALKTEVVMTTNLREWLHVFKLRCSPRAHPMIRSLMQRVRAQFRARIPSIFGEEEHE